MGAPLDHLAVVKDGDLVAELAGGKPMADVDRGLIPGDVVELGVDLGLGDGVEGGGGLVQDDEGGVLIQGAGNGDLLRFAARDVHAVLGKLLVQHGVQARRHSGQTVGKPGVRQGLFGTGAVIVLCAGHVRAQRLGQQLEVLEHHREQSHVIAVIVLADVDAV